MHLTKMNPSGGLAKSGLRLMICPVAAAAWLCCAISAFAQSPTSPSQVGAERKNASQAQVQELPEVNVIADAVTRADSQAYTPVKRANVTRTGLDAKQTPYTVETVDTQSHREHARQDLGSMLEGVAGVDASHMAWADTISIRGFSAGTSDIYRDGVRTGGSFRRSTANVERVEILKGPASVLYGRSQGGGVINMVSKKANFDAHSTASVRAGSWEGFGVGLDFNRVFSDQLAVRLNADYDQGNSFRQRIRHRSKLISPSVIWRSTDRRLQWEGQYT